VRKIIAAVGIVVAAMLVGATSAWAQTVLVSPSTGLQDGQVVIVTEEGFLNGLTRVGEFNPAASECRGGIFPASSASSFSSELVEIILRLQRENCVPLGVFASASNSLPVPVGRSFTTPSGSVVSCDTATAGCAIVLFGVTSNGLIGVASTSITFAPRTPPNKDACKNGGWRNYADAHGQPFRNQGACISFATHSSA
jgi:hypothetical protein